MIVVDTNVISEPLRKGHEQRVRDWLNRQAPETLYLSAVTVAELTLGVELLSDGRRKDDLRGAVRSLIAETFRGRVLAFDGAVAQAYASLVADARMRGRSISFADGQIAATASHHSFAVATRDTSPFEACGLTVINPWTAEP
ncbi:type II toxin-antitoxin system VapC family toxin [Aeromicrobium sp. 9AM]|uniref:type II toxin-antitoxin system VapC family toxin n=1 Tax=Aeromicrobium sp. 9AM TaxID=2653126 RepID=UPI0012F111E6|nr:type II toxin-antitoxin system VapC family toxin [Aeromicrobium sp. 9AM]VXB34529.1 Plasmid stability protein StbB [Aeromicrobium sp. 9AM]